MHATPTVPSVPAEQNGPLHAILTRVSELPALTTVPKKEKKVKTSRIPQGLKRKSKTK